MILPPDFINTISADALNDFLDHLIISNAGVDSYEGNLETDRQRLLTSLRNGSLLIEHRCDTEHDDEDEQGSFCLIAREQAASMGYERS